MEKSEKEKLFCVLEDMGQSLSAIKSELRLLNLSLNVPINFLIDKMWCEQLERERVEGLTLDTTPETTARVNKNAQ